MTRFVDEQRSARLLFARELADGTLAPGAIDRPAVRAALSSKPVPSALARGYQRLLAKRGRLGFEQTTVPELVAAREAVLGPAAAGPPRPLIRVDEFPHANGVEMFRRLHAALTEAGISYLLAVSPRVARDYLDPSGTVSRPLSDGERDLLLEARRDGVTFALHGLDHRTRRPDPRRHAEWAGYSADELEERLELALGELAEMGVLPRVLVPPFNRFDAKRWPVLARRFDVVFTGPEAIALMGYHHTPLFRGDAVYMPAGAPFYGYAHEVAPALARLREQRAALWVPIVLHSGWESRDGGAGLRELTRVAGGLDTSWETFLDATASARR
jgi:predicted deacetylase